jgi:hypothetical protein
VVCIQNPTVLSQITAQKSNQKQIFMSSSLPVGYSLFTSYSTAPPHAPSPSPGQAQKKSLKTKPERQPWTAEEDQTLADWVRQHGPQRWSSIIKALPNHEPRDCRERWQTHHAQQCRPSPWTAAEDAMVIRCQEKWGNKWARISALLPGRTDNSVKNRWLSALKKKVTPPEIVPESAPTQTWFFPSPRITFRPSEMADVSDSGFFEGLTFGEFAPEDIDDITF